MSKFLLIGFDPQALDFSDPTVPNPSGETAQELAAEVVATQKQFVAQGDQLDNCKVQIDASSAEASVTAQFARSTYDCILIGGGIREPDQYIEILERIINSIRQNAPDTPIGFVPAPRYSAKAVERVLSVQL